MVGVVDNSRYREMGCNDQGNIVISGLSKQRRVQWKRSVMALYKQVDFTYVLYIEDYLLCNLDNRIWDDVTRMPLFSLGMISAHTAICMVI